jgi:Holliday junction resolvase RusA-like endonuclease
MPDAPVNLQQWLGQFQKVQDASPAGDIAPSANLNELAIEYDVLPPSSNHIYFRGTTLTREAREYAERFAHHVRKHLPDVMNLDSEAIYHVELYFHFQGVENFSYKNPKVAPSKQAKFRYKRFDLDNRIKLLVDCLRDAVGIDDSQIFAFTQVKLCDPLRPRVEIILRRVSPNLFGLSLKGP